MLSREQIIEAIELLTRVGCEVVFNCPHPIGSTTVMVSAQDAASYAKGEINLPAKLTGLTPQEFSEWVSSEGRMQCFARTRTGHRCKRIISGHQITDPREWKRLNESQPYCATHGG